MKKYLVLFVVFFVVSCGGMGASVKINEPILATYDCKVSVTDSYAYFMRDGKPTRALKKLESCLYGDIMKQESHSRYFRIEGDGIGWIYGSDIARECRIINGDPFSACKVD